MKVFMKHIRKAKMCSGGGRSFFERHGLDWSDFLKNGIDVEIIEGLGDHMANQVVKIVREEG